MIPVEDEASAHAKLFFAVTTRLDAGQVAERYADELGADPPESRPELWGVAAGAVYDPCFERVRRYKPARMGEMLKDLRRVNAVISCSGEAYDIGVLSPYGDVGGLVGRHVELREIAPARVTDPTGSGGGDAPGWETRRCKEDVRALYNLYEEVREASPSADGQRAFSAREGRTA